MTFPSPNLKNRPAFYFGWRNLFEEGIVTASSEAAAGPKENAYDWLTYDSWQTNSGGTNTIQVQLTDGEFADYAAIYGHNLHLVSGRVFVEYWDGAAWVEVGQEMPGNASPIWISFDITGADLWRLRFTSTAPIFIAQANIGRATAMPVGIWGGFTPPPLARRNEYITSISDGGQFLGRSVISEGQDFQLNFDYLDSAFVREEFYPFMLHFEKKPAFMQWARLDFPEEVALIWLDGQFNGPSNQNHRYMQVGFSARGLA